MGSAVVASRLGEGILYVVYCSPSCLVRGLKTQLRWFRPLIGTLLGWGCDYQGHSPPNNQLPTESPPLQVVPAFGLLLLDSSL